jgi:hypothetical protein
MSTMRDYFRFRSSSLPPLLSWLNLRFRKFVILAFVLAFSLTVAGGCKKLRHIDTKPLDQAGMDYTAIQEVKGLDPSDAEIAELAKAKMGGLGDHACIELLRIYRSQNRPAKFADAADNLVQVGMTEDDILQLARMKQLGVGSGELQAMRLTGLSDAVVMEVARRHAAGKTALSGVSLAHLKDAGYSQAALFELVRRGVRDDRVAQAIALRHQRLSETEILKHYSPGDVVPEGGAGMGTPVTVR